MRIIHVSANNWRNFKSVDFSIGNRLFIVGPNAAGKSNLLDLFRFLSDIASPGGGLAAAFNDRGGLGKVRSLFARNWQNGRLTIDIQLMDGADTWRYRLAIKGEGKGKNRPIVDEEKVEQNGEFLLQRPNTQDRNDPELLTQTHLEQISANREFRPIAEYFGKVRYYHLVPQVIRDPARAGLASSDPFGGDFIAQMNGVQARTRGAWLRKMEAALRAAVPKFESLAIEVDDAGRPHLTAGYQNWRQNATRQNETEFSDGTLRLIGLLWAIVSTPANGGVLLLEEPELSLNAAIVRTLPTVLATAQRDKDLQVLLSTHAPEILDDEGVLPHEVLVLRVTDDGTKAVLLDKIPEVAGDIVAGLPTSDTVQSLIDPPDLAGLRAVGASRAR
ncbi:MAG: chromosome segregation protein SMC [Mycolicibacterium sp.]|uniref:AAA family ATPase n=1 Tax=Mycolicibacterium sp. TaxID=2320850 RepID=UPI000FB2A63C|nr:ATP-binding protein [Mycolicibacterium sp.]RUP33737.1 MAG: chromosome segregation protein SMC [Mycolicibacterium sp.]